MNFDDLARGELWTVAEAAAELELSPKTIYAWEARGHIEPAVPDEPRLFWSHDLYDRQHNSRHQTATRDAAGKFKGVVRPL